MKNVVVACIIGDTRAIAVAACTKMGMVTEDASSQGPKRLRN